MNFLILDAPVRHGHTPGGTVGAPSTDREGVATLVLPRGLEGEPLAQAPHPARYEADFDTITTIDGKNYCNSSGFAPLAINDGSS